MPTANPEIMTEVPHVKIRLILQDMGMRFTESSHLESVNFFFELGGYHVILRSQVTDLTIMYQDNHDKVSLERINDWNSNYRFGRAYFVVRLGPSVESDLEFTGGVTTRTIEAFIYRFGTTVSAFGEFVSRSRSSP
jgi:hypothetical protein